MNEKNNYGFDALIVKYDASGLVPVIARDVTNGEVLMLAYMNAETLGLTLATGRMHYFSRRRQEIWEKGKTSGNVQKLVALCADCDGDTLLADIEQTGPACHNGTYSCFGDKPVSKVSGAAILEEVYNVIADRKTHPKEGSYTNYLFDKGIDKILKKIGEESAEVIIAAKNQMNDETRYEMADLLYHLMVLMVNSGIEWEDIFKELESRR